MKLIRVAILLIMPQFFWHGCALERGINQQSRASFSSNAGSSAQGTQSLAGVSSAPSNTSQQPSFAPLVDQVRPSVVGVTTHTKELAPKDISQLWRQFLGSSPKSGEEQIGLGSGVIVDAKGLVLTNNHVVAGAQEVWVKTSDGKEYRAKVKGTDPPTDLAVLQLADVKEHLSVATFGVSDAIRVGDYVIAIGNPFGLNLTVTNGIISAKARTIGIGPYDEFLQTNAAINPGNSGGPLFDMNGHVVGINTAITATGQGIGFAVPIDLAKALLPQLEQKGRVVRGFLGVAVQDFTPELSRALGSMIDSGALVANVEPGSPAAKAGLKPGDVIIALNAEPISNAAQLSRRVALLPPGQVVTIEYIRNKVTGSVEATLSERPVTDNQQNRPPVNGHMQLDNQASRRPSVVPADAARS